MNVGDKVSKESQGNRQSPDDEPLVTPVVEINHLIDNDGIFWSKHYYIEAPFQEGV